MKQDTNAKNRPYGRGFNSKKQVMNKNTVLESSGPAGKIRGNMVQIYDKYLTLGKEAMIQNDRVLSEIFYQYADYYHRLYLIASQEDNKNHFPPKNNNDMNKKPQNQEVSSSADSAENHPETEQNSGVEKSVADKPVLNRSENKDTDKKTGKEETASLPVEKQTSLQSDKKEPLSLKKIPVEETLSSEKTETIIPVIKKRGRPRKIEK